MIIPVYNDIKGVRDTLESMENQSLEKEDFEVIIVDNNSTDGTNRVVTEFEDRNSNFIGVEENRIQSSYAARNKGIRKSKGDIICFIDSDMWVESSYLADIKQYFVENEEIEYIGCNVKMVRTSDSLTSLYNKRKGFPVEDYLEKKNFAPTCCLSVRSEIFEDLGYFRESLISGGDKEFGLRTYRAGYKMRYVPEIRVYHPTRNKVQDIAQKYFRIGRGWYQKRVEREGRNREEQKKITPGRVFSKALWNIKSILGGLKNHQPIRKTLFFNSLDLVKDISTTTGYIYQSIIYRKESLRP